MRLKVKLKMYKKFEKKKYLKSYSLKKFNFYMKLHNFCQSGCYKFITNTHILFILKNMFKTEYLKKIGTTVHQNAKKSLKVRWY